MDEGYGRFGSYSRVELERFFHLDDEDRRLVALRRRDYNRLGFAVQMVTVRHGGGEIVRCPLESVCSTARGRSAFAQGSAGKGADE